MRHGDECLVVEKGNVLDNQVLRNIDVVTYNVSQYGRLAVATAPHGVRWDDGRARTAFSSPL